MSGRRFRGLAVGGLALVLGCSQDSIVRVLGPENVVLSSDLGQPGRVTHAEAFRIALTVLARAGFSQSEIDMMTRTNPARFLGLR